MLLFIGFWIFLAVIFALLNSIFSKDTLDMTDFNEDLDLIIYKKRLSDINNSRNNGTTCSKAGE